MWLSTGLRAVDHCVETICSSNPNPEGTKHSLRGLKLLLPGLLRTKQEPNDLEARLRCQLGAAESMRAANLYGVKVGTSDYFQAHKPGRKILRSYKISVAVPNE